MIIISSNWIIRKILLTVATVSLCLAQSERDIVLTPKLSLHRNGKILYYEPKTNDDISGNNSTRVPWEQTLKHVTFLTLHNRIDEKSQNISDLSEYKSFMNSTYIQSNEYIPKFGDIITLARGRLEKLPNNQYYFIEGQCTKRCTEYPSKLIAHWIIQKIRHRDPEKKFRYELKIGVIPNVGDNKSDSSKRETTTGNKHESKAFILKEDDYPKNFANVENHVAKRRSDGNAEYVDRLDQFNDIFSQPQYFRNNIYSDVQDPKKYLLSDLNTGEYIPNHEVTSDTIISNGASSYNRILFPTTFHPNFKLKVSNGVHHDYGIKFPEEALPHTEKLTPAAHHLHHHFYITKSNFPEMNSENSYGPPYPLKDSPGLLHHKQFDIHQFHTTTPIANQIPVPPNLQIPNESYKFPITRPVIPSSLLHMQGIPVYPVFPFGEQIQPKYPYTESSKPFIETPQVPTVRYSDPDPLYHSTNEEVENLNNNENILPTTRESSSEENLSEHLLNSVTQETENYDSDVSESEKSNNSSTIDAQLSAPDPDDQAQASHIESHTETSYVTQTSAVSAFLVAPRASTEPSTTPSKIETTITESSTENLNHQQDFENNFQTIKTTTLAITGTPPLPTTTIQIPIVKRNYRLTTERPVLKWKPKRPIKVSKITLPNISITTPNSVHKSANPKFEFERIPVNTTEKIITVTPSKSDAENDEEDIPTKQSVSTSISIKVGTETQERPFRPTLSLPNVELFKADLENVKTNSSQIKLYKASNSKKSPSKNEKNEEHELTKSIVQHVQNLT